MRDRSKRTAFLSVQLVPWMAPPSIWLATPYHLAHVDGDHEPAHAHIGRAFDLGHHDAVSGEVLVAAEADAVADAVSLGPRRPAGAPCCCLECCPACNGVVGDTLHKQTELLVGYAVFPPPLPYALSGRA